MSNWKIRITGLTLMLIGGILFVGSVKYVQSEWPQIFSGLLSVISTTLGFALLIMPLDLHDKDPSPD
jgi:hypothetical protein